MPGQRNICDTYPLANSLCFCNEARKESTPEGPGVINYLEKLFGECLRYLVRVNQSSINGPSSAESFGNGSQVLSVISTIEVVNGITLIRESLLQKVISATRSVARLAIAADTRNAVNLKSVLIPPDCVIPSSIEPA